MKLQIIFEDSEILVLEKPAGLVVNRSETVKEETLQDLLSTYFNLGDDLGIGDRVGMVHRLDRETSGLFLVAKTQKSFENLLEPALYTFAKAIFVLSSIAVKIILLVPYHQIIIASTCHRKPEESSFLKSLM